MAIVKFVFVAILTFFGLFIKEGTALYSKLEEIDEEVLIDGGESSIRAYGSFKV